MLLAFCVNLFSAFAPESVQRLKHDQSLSVYRSLLRIIYSNINQ